MHIMNILCVLMLGISLFGSDSGSDVLDDSERPLSYVFLRAVVKGDVEQVEKIIQDKQISLDVKK